MKEAIYWAAGFLVLLWIGGLGSGFWEKVQKPLFEWSIKRSQTWFKRHRDQRVFGGLGIGVHPFAYMIIYCFAWIGIATNIINSLKLTRGTYIDLEKLLGLGEPFRPYSLSATIVALITVVLSIVPLILIVYVFLIESAITYYDRRFRFNFILARPYMSDELAHRMKSLLISIESYEDYERIINKLKEIWRQGIESDKTLATAVTASETQALAPKQDSPPTPLQNRKKRTKTH